MRLEAATRQNRQGLSVDALGFAEAMGDAAGPIMAGRRARAVADACEARGLTVILLDATGRILHASRTFGMVASASLMLAADHVVGCSEQANTQLQTLLTAALGEAGGGPWSATIAGEDERALHLVALNNRDASPFQLMKAVVIVSADGRPPAEIVAAVEDVLRA